MAGPREQALAELEKASKEDKSKELVDAVDTKKDPEPKAKAPVKKADPVKSGEDKPDSSEEKAVPEKKKTVAKKSRKKG